jgi:hypothetical protein
MLMHPDQNFREAVASHDRRLRRAVAEPRRAARLLRGAVLLLAGGPRPRL